MSFLSRLIEIGFQSERARQIAGGEPGELKFGLWVEADIPEGWLNADGETIGNGSSGATGRANRDTQELFVLLWNNTADAELPIENSSGTPLGSRGSTALADFRANKRLPLPNMTASMPMGRSSGGTGNAMCSTGGAVDHTHSAPAHYHGMGTGADLTAELDIEGTSGAGSAHNHAISAVKYTSDTSHAHQNNAGQLAEAPDPNGGAATASSTDNESSHTHTIAHTHESSSFDGVIGLKTGGVDGNAAMTSGTGNAPFLAGTWIIAY